MLASSLLDDPIYGGAVRILQQHAIRGVVSGAITGEDIGKTIAHEAGSAALASAKVAIADSIPGSDVQSRVFRAGMHNIASTAYTEVMGASPLAAAASTLASEVIGTDVASAEGQEVQKLTLQDFAPVIEI